MKKLCFLFVFSLFAMGSVFAQGGRQPQTSGDFTRDPGGELRSLLPEGVTAFVNNTRKLIQQKNITVAGSKEKGYLAFFAATDAAHGEELWVTNGTPDGTRIVKDIIPGPTSSNVVWLTRFNDKVVFQADDGVNGAELWISDGTEQGTYMVKDIHELASSDPKGFTQLNETQFVFAAKNFDSEEYNGGQHWLWVSDGTEEGTKLIYECKMGYPGTDNGSPYSPYCRVGRKVFFKADDKDGKYGEELWVTDGTEAGTHLVKDMNVEPNPEVAGATMSAAIDDMVNFYNEKLFFQAWSYEYGGEPFASDGTEEGTYLIYDTRPGKDENNSPQSGWVSDASPIPYNGKIYFCGWHEEHISELAFTNLEPGNYGAFDVNENVPGTDGKPKNSSPDAGVEFDGVYMFSANSGGTGMPLGFGGELHYTDGEDVYLHSDLGTGKLNAWVKEPIVASGSMYYWDSSVQNKEWQEKLFRVDSKSDFPVRVTNIKPGEGDKVHSMRNLGGDVIFAINEGEGIYCYHYRKPDYDPIKDADNLDIEYRTRAEIGTSIENIPVNGGNKAQIYPNPASDKFFVKTTGTVKKVEIYDSVGRLVKVVDKPSENAVDVSSLAEGMYLINVQSTKGVSSSNLIIKK